MEREQALHLVFELAVKWGQQHEWRASFKAADRFREYRDKGTERFDKLSDERHSQVTAAHSEFLAMENLLRLHAPALLELVPRVNFFTDAANDHAHHIRDLQKLEGAVLLLTTVQSSSGDELNVWKRSRDQNPKITISDQMHTLFTKDASLVDRKNLSGEVSRILGCSPQAVRHPDNAAWKFFRTEQARRRIILQESKNKRWTDSEQNDADD